MQCPLCGGRNTVLLRKFASAPIETYWKSIGYDVRAAHPQWPAEIEKQLCLSCDLRFFALQMIGGPDLYSALGRTGIYYGAAKWEFIQILQWLAQRNRGGAMLEYGCGRGRFLEHGAGFFDRAVGIDFNTDAVADCRARGLDVRTTALADMSDEEFDVIAAFQVIEHVPNPGEVLRDLVRLLKPGGALIIAVPNEDSLLGELGGNYLNLPPHHASCWTARTFTFAAEMLSLKLTDYLCEPLGTSLYLTALNERLDQYLPPARTLMRPLSWLARRLATAMAVGQFETGRQGKPGHTHIAILRKPGGTQA